MNSPIANFAKQIKDNAKQVYDNFSGQDYIERTESENVEKFKINHNDYDKFLQRYLTFFNNENSFEEILSTYYNERNADKTNGGIREYGFNSAKVARGLGFNYNIEVSCVKASVEHLYFMYTKQTFPQGEIGPEEFRFFLGTIYFDSRFRNNPEKLGKYTEIRGERTFVIGSCVKEGYKFKEDGQIFFRTKNPEDRILGVRPYFLMYLKSNRWMTPKWSKSYKDKYGKEYNVEDAFNDEERETYITKNQKIFAYEDYENNKKIWIDPNQKRGGGVRKKHKLKKTRKRRRHSKSKRKTQ
jgi:hypothetical protein